jgi:hypothetical protein
VEHGKFLNPGAGIWSVPVAGGDEEHITEALHPGYWGYFAVADSGPYLVDSEAKGGPTIMYYNFKTRPAYTRTHTEAEVPQMASVTGRRVVTSSICCEIANARFEEILFWKRDLACTRQLRPTMWSAQRKPTSQEKSAFDVRLGDLH